MEKGEYKIKETDTVVHIEFIGENNKRAWSQFIRVNQR